MQTEKETANRKKEVRRRSTPEQLLDLESPQIVGSFMAFLSLLTRFLCY